MNDRHEAPTDRDPEGHVGMPADTGPNPPAMAGTSENARPVQGIYPPGEQGPGAPEVDTDERAMPGRARTARGADQRGSTERDEVPPVERGTPI